MTRKTRAVISVAVLALYGVAAFAQTLNPIWPQTADLITQGENLAAQLMRFPPGGECWGAGSYASGMIKPRANFMERQFQTASIYERQGRGEGAKFLNTLTPSVSGFYKELEPIVKQAALTFEKCRTGKAR